MTRFPVLEHYFLFQNIVFCFRTSFSCFRTSFSALSRNGFQNWFQNRLQNGCQNGFQKRFQKGFQGDRRKKNKKNSKIFLKKFFEIFFCPGFALVLSRDVPGQKSLSRDFCNCPCPGTKGQQDRQKNFVPGQRDNGTRKLFCPRTKGQRDVPSLGNPNTKYVVTCKFASYIVVFVG